MCVGMIAGLISAAHQITGGWVGMFGDISEGKAIKRASEEQAKELQYQAAIEKQRKTVEDANAEQQLQNLGIEAQGERAAALTQFAASGQTIANGGFVQRYLDDSARITAREESIVDWNRNVANWGHDANANSLKNQSILTRMEGKRAKRAANYRAFATVNNAHAGAAATVANSFSM